MFVLSICSLKGGVGKTSVALGLASAALARDMPTLVVDLDPQGDATLGLDVPDGLAVDVGQVLAAPRASVVGQAVTPSGWNTGSGRLDVLPGSAATEAQNRPANSERTLARLAEALRHVSGYRLAIIDCPPSLGGLTRTALAASHRAIVVTEPALFSVTAADRALRAIEDLRREHARSLQPLGVLVNRYRERSPEHRYRVEEMAAMFGPLVIGPAIPERSALQQAQGASQPVHRWPGSAARELAERFDAHLARVIRAANREGRKRDTTAGG
jgi:cellulose biosynthesis protein BcsQ